MFNFIKNGIFIVNSFPLALPRKKIYLSFMSNTVQFSVRVDFKACERYIENLNHSQLPYAVAVTLTRLAQGSQNKIRVDMEKYFTLRSKKRLQAGVRIIPARKGDFKRGTIHSSVTDIDPFMAIHTTGGIKTPSKHRYLSIPTDYLLDQGARTSTGAIKERFKPAALIKQMQINKNRRAAGKGRRRKPLPFIMKIGEHAVIAQRVGRGKYPVKYLYGFEKEGAIKKAWPFAEAVAIYCRRYTTQIFNQEFQNAIRSAA